MLLVRLLFTTVDDINPALPMIRNIPEFPLFGVLKVMQGLYHQQYSVVEPEALNPQTLESSPICRGSSRDCWATRAPCTTPSLG